ncbi:sacsin-like isoform X2 [Mercenaria mercenaria]|nr:sacsin-like isoform X2 [Mercenaria mercenaria]
MVKLKNLKKWHRLNNEDYMNSLSGTFGFTEDTLTTGMFNGTMFWFPLRQCPSPLSYNTYQEENVLNLLQAFITESQRSLLFLKTLCSIKMFVNMQTKDGIACEQKPPHSDDPYKELEYMNLGKDTECFKVEVNNKSNDLSEERRAFLGELQDIGNEIPDQSKHWVFDITVQTEQKSTKEDKKVAKSRWLIVNYLKGGEISEKLGQLMKDKDLGYPHIVGLAAPIDTNNHYSSTAGHVFCYQPLPQENVCMTGLPVHVNGFFALSQNRRHVRWPDQGDTTNGQGDKKIEWNIVLRTQILPEAYERLMAELVSLCRHEENPDYLLNAVYSAVPDLSVVEEHWSDLASAVPELCKNMAVVYTKQNDGKWIRPQEAVFTSIWKCVDNQTDQNDDFDVTQKEEYMETVFDLLLSDKVNVVNVPYHIADAFDNACSALTYATPAYMKLHMKNHNTYKDLDMDKKQDLFEFVMLESSREGLEKLELLPLEDDTFLNFAPGKLIFLEHHDVIKKFPGQEGSFVRADLRPRTITLLTDLTEKGAHCLERLGDDSAAKMAKDILKNEFGERDCIHINSSKIGKWKLWVRGIWNLIQCRFRNSVKKFSDIPIFPKVPSSVWRHVEEFSLLMLKTPILHIPSLIQLEDRQYINRSFELLSVSVIQNIPEDIEVAIVGTYLHEETSESITSLLDRVNYHQVEKFNSESSDVCSAVFLKFLSERIHTNIGKTGKRNLQIMKLFRGYQTVNESELVSLKDTEDVYKNGTQFPVRFPSLMILLNSDAEMALVEKLGANIISELELVRRALRRISDYNSNDKVRFIHWIIMNGEHFQYYDVQESLKEISFLEAEDGSFYKASELFDPTDETLCKLFRDEHVFPKMVAENEQNVVYIDGLRSLGLKTAKNLTWDDIARVCDIIHQTAVEEVAIDKEKCLALLNVMNKHSDLVRKSDIYNKRCLIIEDTLEDTIPQSVQLKNRCSDSSVLVCMPSEILSVKHVQLVGTVMFVIDCKRLSALSKIFDWEAQPKVTKVLEHLFNIVKNYQAEYKASYLPIVTSVYEWLSTQKEYDAVELRNIVHQQFAKPFDAFVWDGNLFQPIKNMYAESAKGDVDLRPFLHPLPSEIEKLADFFQELGCQKSIEFDTYVDTLHQIKCSEQSASDDENLAQTLTEMSIAILNKIKKNFLDEYLDSEEQLYFPTMTENGGIQMMPAKSCTYCDEQWLKNMDFQLDDDIYYVHPELPIATAEALGVPSLRQQMMSDTEAFAEWGQEEPLTRRLRNLLKEGYVDGFSVAKELFQNADDAGAKKLWILFDERENNEAKTRLISEGMAECQGPAIWVYNDAQFTEPDFRNITKLSGATKEDDSTKIGKFGLGFCAVYNITDVPSFVSGESIVIFDPDMSHLGKVLPGKSPGLRVNFRKMSNLKMMKSLKNQFLPFEGVFDCRIIDSDSPFFDSTLFRLPLRNRASDISDVVYSSSEVKSLFDKIMSMAANMLLFNQNVEEFKLLHIPKTERNPASARLLFEIKKNSIRLKPTSNERLNATTILVEASRLKQNKTLRDNPLQVIDKVSVIIRNHVDSKFNALADKQEAKEDWLISWSTGTEGKSVSLAYEEKGALPLGAVAIPFKTTSGSVTSLDVLPLSSVSEQFYQSGHLFFFLPLPIQHRFPFHINSQFTVTTDRRQLRTSTEDDKNVNMKKWNKYLLEDSVTKALLFLLEHLHTLGSLEGYQFHSLWPAQETAELLEHLPRAFYQNVAKPDRYNVFEKNGQWFDISRCVFIERHFRSSAVGKTVFEVLSSLTDFVVDISEEVYDMLLQANRPLIEEKTVSEKQFFLKYFFPRLEEFSSDKCLKEKRKQLLYHAVVLQNHSIDMWLEENKCIPSQPHGCLKRPRDLIDTDSNLSALFVAADGCFPECPFTDRHMLIKLRKLGLMHNVLSNSLVINRANSVEVMNKKCSICAVERSGHMLGYLSENISKHRSTISELGKVKFIPVQAKPNDWFFEWHADILTSKKSGKKCKLHKTERHQLSHFDRPSNIYYSECKTIVGCVAFVFDERSYFMCNAEIKSRGLRNMLKYIGMNGLTEMDIDLYFVLQQLECIATSYGSVTKHIPSSNMSGILQDIYRHLDTACRSNDAFEAVAAATNDKPVVFVSGKFVLPKVVARNCYLDCRPHLFRLKDSPLKSSSVLCKCFKISDYFQPHDIALLLQNIKHKKNDTALTPAEIHTVINIMYCLQDSIHKLHGKMFDVHSIVQDQIQAIYGPDENGILRDCKTMCFNDYDGIEKSKTMIYTHVSFPPDLAKFFGVNPKLIHSLEETTEDFDEDFYQEEPLVTRLNRLVEGYPCDTGIFKELIQNADDAGATEIRFIKDYTTHPKTNIIDPRYEALQGPALLVFNDSAFSNNDLKGIQRLGRGSKSEDPSQTGRYGVGFNAVYNLTDAPSFYTKGGDIENEETLCVFDPLAKYLPKVTRKRPGKRYRNVQWIREFHSNMMSGYHEKMLITGKQGTVFRFPLRTADMAETSEIKREFVDIDMVSVLLKQFSEELSNVLIFLKNLRTVKIFTCKENRFLEEFCLNVKMTSAELEKRKAFIQNQTHLCDIFKEKRQDLFKFEQYEAKYELSMNVQSDSKSQTYDYIVVQVLGLKENAELNPLIRDKILTGEIGLLPHGGLALCYVRGPNSAEDVRWNTQTTCKAFCFLPLPIKTGLPVHVHGYFALDHETRRTLWRSEQTETCFRTLWNNMLFEQVISVAYVNLLKYTKCLQFQKITNNTENMLVVSSVLDNYQLLFPLKDNVSDFYWKHFLTSLYKRLVTEHIDFLPVQNVTTNIHENVHVRKVHLTWTSLKSEGSKFPAYIRKENTTEKGNESHLNTILRRLGMRIVFVSDQIKDSMKFAGVGISFLKPKHVIAFICSKTSQDTSIQKECNIELGEHIVQTTLQSIADAADVLLFCLKDSEQFKLSFKNIPLMVTKDCFVRTVPDNGYFLLETQEDFCEFFPSKRNVFLHNIIAKVLSIYVSEKVDIFQGMVKRFSLSQFVTLVKETNVVEHDCTSLKSWIRTSSEEAWIRKFWEFFSYQLPNEDEKTVFQQLQIMQHLPLIPVVKSSSNDLYLAPPVSIHELIDLQSFSSNPVLHEALKSLNIPHVYNAVFSGNEDSKSFKLLVKQVSNLNTPIAVLECLDINVNQDTMSNLTEDQVNSVLKYFNDCLYENVSPNTLAKLKNIPLFLSHFGKRVSLKCFKNIYVVPSSLPTEGLEDLAVKADVLFLSNTGHQNLFKHLNIKALSLTEVYSTYIIPQQHFMQRICFYGHLEFLSRHLYSEGHEDLKTLLSVLQTMSFVEMHDGTRKRVCDLFDPEHVIFGQMCEKSELVPVLLPDRLKQSNLLRLFRKLGLKTLMTVTLFERFARSIGARSESDVLSESICDNSKKLTEHLLSMNDEFFEKGSFDNLAKIKFVTPHVVSKDLSSIEQQFNCKTLVCFEGSVLNTSENISWTVLNILPIHANPTMHRNSKPDVVLRKLKIRQSPSFETFVCHCRLVGESLGKIMSKMNKSSRSRLYSIMDDMYSAFRIFHENKEINEESLSSLAGVPLIYYPKKKIIVAGKRVVISCRSDEEIPPHLLKYPDSYSRHTDVFLHLGASEEPTCDSFACVLQALKDETKNTGGPDLMPNEHAFAVKAMGHLFKYLANETDEANLSCRKLFLLSENRTLEDARMLIVSNNIYFRQLIDKDASANCMYLIGFNQLQEYRLKSEDCVENLKQLSVAHRPHLLTEVVTERVDLAKIRIRGIEMSSLIEGFIHSNTFLYGFLRLYRHVLESKSKKWKSEDETRILNFLKKITIKQCTGIETVLYLKNIGQQGREIRIADSNAKRFIHTERNKDNTCIYFDTSDAKWEKNVRDHLTIQLTDLVDGCFDTTNSIYLMEIVGMFQTPNEIDLYLSQARIKEYTFDPTTFEESSPSFPIPGEIVPKKFHRYLDNDIGVIYEHDYKFIALEFDDPAFDINDNEAEDEDEDDTECSDKDFEPTYKYVHITRQMGPENELPLLQEYEIDCGSDTKLVVKAFQLYKFVRKNKCDENSTDVVIYARNGNEPQNEIPKEKVVKQTLKEVFCEIRKYLKEAWKKEEHERRRIIKRLMLKWHPDKNPDNITFCTKVFQYIQQCLSLLERGLDLKEGNEEGSDDTGTNRSNTNPFSSGTYNSHSWSYGNTRYDRYWRRYERGRQYNESRYNSDSCNRGGRRANSWYNNFYDTWRARGGYKHAQYEPYHWYSRAKLWYKQAEYDLQHARDSIRQSVNQQFNWPCYSAHQAAEKALKAAWYAKDANKINGVMASHSLEFIARDLGSSILFLAKRLSDVTGDYKAMRYPRCLPGQQIPAETYNKETATAVIDVAQELLALVHSNYIK